MPPNPQAALRFLGPQLRDHGGKAEVAPGCWLLFAVEVADTPGNEVARALLAEAGFPHHAGSSDDDGWVLYYVDEVHRPLAVHWLDDCARIAAGEIRPVAPAQQALIHEIIASDKPHRAAKQLADLHEQGKICAGLIRDAGDARALLDRLHAREPLFFAAFQTLLTHLLFDLVVLHRQLIAEDVELKNEIVKAGLSRDPFLQSRQDATVVVRNELLRFRMINPLDQQKNTSITNPYAVYLEIVREGDTITAPIAGLNVTLPREDFLDAVRSIRRNVYQGVPFASFDTQAPWMNERIAHSFRFIKQRLDSHPELTTLDGLYMIERAV
ncbi:MAG: hypothetical protein WCL04_07180 [Verrucomicrobiota bacterium]